MPNLAKITMKVAGYFARTCKSCSSTQFVLTPSPMRHPSRGRLASAKKILLDLFLGALLEHLRGPVLWSRSGTPKVFVVLFSSGNSPQFHGGTSSNHIGTNNGTFLLQVVLIRIGHCGNAVLRYISCLRSCQWIMKSACTLAVPL